MTPIYLVCGVSGCGKSWACRQVTDKFNYVPHDACWTHPSGNPTSTKEDTQWKPGAVSNHFETLVEASISSTKPILTECPFGERGLREQLESVGITVIPIFVIEPPDLVSERYFKREGKPLPKNAYTRAETIKNRAEEWEAFSGNSNEVLEHLRAISL